MEFLIFVLVTIALTIAGWVLWTPAAKPLTTIILGPLLIGGFRKALHLKILKSPLQRRVGLLNHHKLAEDTGIWLKPCPSIHTLGMTFAIDVVFLGRDNQILAIHEAVLPGCKRLTCRGARSVIELNAGAAATFFCRGDKL